MYSQVTNGSGLLEMHLKGCAHEFSPSVSAENLYFRIALRIDPCFVDFVNLKCFGFLAQEVYTLFVSESILEYDVISFSFQ